MTKHQHSPGGDSPTDAQANRRLNCWPIVLGLTLMTIALVACALAAVLGLLMTWVASGSSPFAVTPQGLGWLSAGPYLFTGSSAVSLVLCWGAAQLTTELDERRQPADQAVPHKEER